MEGLIGPSSLIAVLYSSRRTMTNREIYVSYKTKLDASPFHLNGYDI